MKIKTKAILTLAIITPFLAELLGGNLPPRVFFSPILIALILGYSFPVLLIREITARWRLGIYGIFILGLAYGILNEGIFAKTFFLSENVPMNAFDHYGFYLGLNFGWIPLIMIWHAFHSILFPIIIVNFFYPEIKNEVWVGKKWSYILAFLSLGSGILFFIKTKPELGNWIYLLIFSMAMTVLIFLAKIVPKKEPDIYDKFSIKLLVFGATIIFINLISSFLAALKIHLSLYYLFLAAMLFIIWLVIKQKKWLTIPALMIIASGEYMISAAFGGLSYYLRGFPDGVISAIIFEIIFIILMIVLKKRFLITPQKQLLSED